MNQTVAAVSQVLTKRRTESSDVKGIVRLLFLALLVLVSALTVVYFKDLSRREFIVFQRLGNAAQVYQVSWGKLLLEQSAWSTQSRVQLIAQKKLNMIMPASSGIVMIKDASLIWPSD